MTISAKEVQDRLDKADIELTITKEGVKASAKGVWRIAYYGGGNDFGDTYWCGTLDQVETYLLSIKC